MEALNALVALANYVLIPAVTYGSQLALGALGVTLVYGILRFSNFAHGDTMALGTVATILGTWGLQSLAGVPGYGHWLLVAGIALAVLSVAAAGAQRMKIASGWILVVPPALLCVVGLALAAVAGILPTALAAIPAGIAATALLVLGTDRLVYHFYRVQRARPVILVIVSMGVMFIYNGISRITLGPDDLRFADGPRFVIGAREFRDLTGLSEGLAFKTSQAITIVTALLVVAALFWFLRRTRTGKSMRAYADNEDLALLSGINPDHVVRVTWLLVAALATIAGVLYGLDKSYSPFTYFQLLLPIFASAILGGMGSPLGAIAGGFIIAFSEVGLTYAWKKVLGYFLPEALEPSALVQLLSTEYKFAVSFVILVIVLLFRPTGIFRGTSV